MQVLKGRIYGYLSAHVVISHDTNPEAKLTSESALCALKSGNPGWETLDKATPVTCEQCLEAQKLI